MSAVDVLHILGTEASMARTDGRYECGNDLDECRKAVAELIKALGKGATMPVDGKSPALYFGPIHADRVRAALARCGGTP